MSLLRNNLPPEFFAATGNMAGVEVVDIFGYNGVVGAGAAEVISTDGPATPAITLAVPASMQVLSSSVNDDVGSTGAEKIIIEGVDSTFAAVSEEIEMDGTTPVSTINTYIRVNAAYVSEAGTVLGANIGNIVVRVPIALTTVIQIAAAAGRGQTSVYTVPLGKTLLLAQINFAIENTKAVDIKIMARENAGIVQDPAIVVAQFSGIQLLQAFPLGPFNRLNEKTDLWVTGQSTSGDAKVSVGMRGYLLDNTVWNL